MFFFPTALLNLFSTAQVAVGWLLYDFSDFYFYILDLVLYRVVNYVCWWRRWWSHWLSNLLGYCIDDGFVWSRMEMSKLRNWIKRLGTLYKVLGTVECAILRHPKQENSHMRLLLQYPRLPDCLPFDFYNAKTPASCQNVSSRVTGCTSSPDYEYSDWVHAIREYVFLKVVQISSLSFQSASEGVNLHHECPSGFDQQILGLVHS